MVIQFGPSSILIPINLIMNMISSFMSRGGDIQPLLSGLSSKIISEFAKQGQGLNPQMAMPIAVEVLTNYAPAIMSTNPNMANMMEQIMQTAPQILGGAKGGLPLDPSAIMGGLSGMVPGLSAPQGGSYKVPGIGGSPGSAPAFNPVEQAANVATNFLGGFFTGAPPAKK